MRISLCTFLVLVFVFFSNFSVWSQTKTETSFIKVTGEVTKPLTLYAADLAKMKRAESSFKDRDGKILKYSGVPVSEILKEAGVTIGKELKGENLSKYLLVKAADGYEVLFSLAELDSSFTDRVVILADKVEGGPLPAGKGPFRIIVPGEKKPARCIFEVTEFAIRFAKE